AVARDERHGALVGLRDRERGSDRLVPRQSVPDAPERNCATPSGSGPAATRLFGEKGTLAASRTRRKTARRAGAEPAPGSDRALMTTGSRKSALRPGPWPRSAVALVQRSWAMRERIGITSR